VWLVFGFWQLKEFFRENLVGAEKCRLWKTTCGLHPLSLWIRWIFRVGSWNDLHRLVKQVPSELCDLVSFVVGVVVVHVADAFDDCKLETQVVAKCLVVASLCHLVSLLNVAEAVIQKDDLVTGLLETTFCFCKRESLVERFHIRAHLE